MEYPPPPPGSLHNLGYQEALPNQPASIQIISVFAIVIGSLIVLCDGIGAVFGGIALALGHSAFMAQQAQNQPVSVTIFNVAQAVVGLLLGGMLLAGGIGGVQLRAWARTLLVKWAAANLVFQAVTCALAIYFMLAVTMPAVQQQMNRQGRGAPPQQFLSFFSVGGVAMVVLITLIACILPICVLIFWRRPNVIAAFESGRPLFN